MKDALGEILKEGDLILDVRTNFAWFSGGVIKGGVTKSGRIRYFGFEGRTHTCSHFIIKATKEQFRVAIEQRVLTTPFAIRVRANAQTCIEIHKEINNKKDER